MQRNEFTQFQCASNLELTFCLREFKAFVSFAESCNLYIGLHFDSPGAPIIVSTEGSGFTGELVLATLADDSATPIRQSPPGTTNSQEASMRLGPAPLAHLIATSSPSQRLSHSQSSSPRSMDGRRRQILPVYEDDFSIHSSDDVIDNDVMPPSPPSKKFRSLFFGLSQTSSTSRPLTSADVADSNDVLNGAANDTRSKILVEDSDNEDFQ